MKKTLLILSLFFAAYGLLHPQELLKLTSTDNTYQTGDSLYKYQVEYKDPGSVGRELEWDFTKLDVKDENYLIKYFYPNKDDTTRICGMEHRTRYYYRQQNDSVWATGFENYTTKMDYTTPELKMKFPFAYGDTLFSTFEGEGIYSNMLDLRAKGYTRVKADAEGMLKLPDLKGKAIRVHTRRHYTEVKADRDRFQVSGLEFQVGDSGLQVPKHSTPNDTLRMTLDTYSWYVQDIRYPVFESIKTTIHRATLPALRAPSPGGETREADTTVFRTSFYYTPEELPTKNNPDEPEIPEIERVFTEATMVPNPVVNDLMIDYKLTRPALIRFSVHNNIGIPMRRTTQRNLPEGRHHETIPMGGLVTGTYTVYVHVDDMVLSRVVVKR